MLFISHKTEDKAIANEVLRRALARGNSDNRSDSGAETQSILMSLFRTLQQRDLDPIPTTLQALAQHLTTSQSPPRPARDDSDG